MPCYIEYSQRERMAAKEIEEKCADEIQKAQEKTYQIRNVCRNMLVCDYLKWQRREDEQGSVSLAIWEQIHKLPPKARGQVRNIQVYASPARARQSILACIEMFKHPYFKEVVSLPTLPDDEIEHYSQSQMSQLETLLTILDNSDVMFTDLWTQAFFSTDYFSKERYKYDRTPQFEVLFEQAMISPKSCQFVSELSARKIAEYHEQENRIVAVQEKYAREKQKRLDNMPDEYWSNHKDEILQMILSEHVDTLRSIFKNSNLQIERLVAYVEAKKTLAQIDSKIEDMQTSVDKIWDQYKDKYQLFRKITEKGAC